MTKTYAAGRRLKIGDGWREPGDLVPEAYTWLRMQDWLHTGYLKEVDVEDGELRSAISKFCPELSEQILGLAGLDPNVTLHGPQKSPQRVTALKGKGK